MLQKTDYQHRLSIAPMMEWTDRHCRYFHRLITKSTLLYTEMVTTGALLHGAVEQHLAFNNLEQPVALQLGGSDPHDLAQCAKLGQTWGYSEINLNCGCPSSRVQKGAFGACLMLEPTLVADCIKAMVDVVGIPVTVKHRIGIDSQDSYDFVAHFIGEVSQSGCNTFIVHARSAWLNGLSPKENRSIPPLRYEVVYRLKQEFPHLNIVLNGGVMDNLAISQHLKWVDGVMVGREAYHNPWLMHDWDEIFWGASPSQLSREAVEFEMVKYMQAQLSNHKIHSWNTVARHLLGLYHGQKGARRWRQIWSNGQFKKTPPDEVFQLAKQEH